jgi:hypothetical protein
LVQSFVDCGAITAEEAKQHPYRHVILESVGAQKLPVVEVDRDPADSPCGGSGWLPSTRLARATGIPQARPAELQAGC